MSRRLPLDDGARLAYASGFRAAEDKLRTLLVVELERFAASAPADWGDAGELDDVLRIVRETA